MGYYSNSRLSTYEQCPWKYKLVYLDRIETEEEGIEAFLGKRFHETMEKLYGELPFRTMTLEELKAYYREKWDKNFHNKLIVTVQDRTVEDYFRLGLKFIEDYYRRYFPFNQNRVLGLEQQIEVDLDGTRKYLIIGFVDRIDLTPDGVIEIHDYKTGLSLPEQAQTDADRQLAIYQLGVQRKWPWAEKFRLVWHYVAFDLEITSSRTPEQLEQLKQELRELIDRIEADREFAPKESVLCEWCVYWDYCPIKKHEATVEKLPVNEYLNEEGVVLVNKYMEYLSRKKEAEEELEKLKEAIIKYAEKNNLTRLVGSEFYLTLSKRERLKIPGVGEENRALLEDLIRNSGLWDRFSTLDRYALEKAVKSGQIEGELLERISELVEREVQISLYPGEIKQASD